MMRNPRPGEALFKEALALKAKRRRRLARLPMKEKLRILLHLQRMENAIRRAAGRKAKPEWTIEV